MNNSKLKKENNKKTNQKISESYDFHNTTAFYNNQNKKNKKSTINYYQTLDDEKTNTNFKTNDTINFYNTNNEYVVESTNNKNSFDFWNAETFPSNEKLKKNYLKDIGYNIMYSRKMNDWINPYTQPPKTKWNINKKRY